MRCGKSTGIKTPAGLERQRERLFSILCSLFCYPYIPASFTVFFFLHDSQTTFEQAGATQITKQAVRVLTVYHGQTTDVVFEHSCHCIFERFIRIGDDQIPTAGLQHSQLALGVILQGADNVTARDDPYKRSLCIYNGSALPARHL